MEDGKLRYRLKNDNERGHRKIWRYHHYRSYVASNVKFATIMACLRKVSKMASDQEEMFNSAMDKVHEFRELEYPNTVLKEACRILGVTSKEKTWFEVHHTIPP